MPYALTFHLDGTLAITLQKGNGEEKTKSVDVVDLYQEGNTVTVSGGKKGVLLTHKGMFKATLEMNRVAREEQLVHDKIMKLIHSKRLRDNSAKIVEEMKVKGALSELLKVMSSEQVISEEQLNTIDQKPSVKEGVDNLVSVLENAEPEKFLLFVDILKRKRYNVLIELLDCRSMYPDCVRHILNLNGVVDHYFVTKKESEVKNSLESARGVIIHGMPGSGKTQLAMKVASDFAHVHPHSVVWAIDGSSQNNLNTGILDLQGILSGEADKHVGRNIFQSLASRWKHFLLLINDLSQKVEIPPQLLRSSAKLIVTTQDSLLAFEDVTNIPQDGFTEDEAVKFLSSQMPPETSTEQMRELANVFSCLPLGLAAARASIYRCSMTVEGYRRQLQGGREAMEALIRGEDSWLQMHYKKEHQEAARNIFAALQLAVDKLDDQWGPEEKTFKVMLQHCAFLEPDNIPVLILKAALTDSSMVGSEAHFTERMKMYSLGSIDGEGVKRRLTIHGVTQRALRLQMDKEQQTACINKVLQILVKFFSKDTMYSEMYKFSVALMPHVEAVLKHADKLKLGPEYLLMKARLLMVCGHLLIQKGTSALSHEFLTKANKLFLQFVGLPGLDIDPAQSEYPNYDSISKELYKALTDTSRSLTDSYIQETVVSRVITKQHLRVLSDKLEDEDRETLTNMVDNVEPLTMEMYRKLVDTKLAIPVKTLKRIFLLELYMYINFERIIVARLYDYSKSEIPDFSLYIVLQIVQQGSYIYQRVKEYLRDRKPTIILHLKVMTCLFNEILAIKETVKFYDFGLLMSEGVDILTTLSCYEKLLKCYVFLVDDGEAGENSDFITKGEEMCKKLLELAESEVKAGNPPLNLAQYYVTIAMFKAIFWTRKVEEENHVGKQKEAAEMLWKAYRVELKIKREEYHPTLGEALMGLIHVRIAQNELGRARVCARRLLELTQDHWSDVWLTAAEEALAKVRSMIVVRAFKQNMEEQKSKLKVTTV